MECFSDIRNFRLFLGYSLGYFEAILRPLLGRIDPHFYGINMVLRVYMSSDGPGKCHGIIIKIFENFCQKNPKTHFYCRFELLGLC